MIERLGYAGIALSTQDPRKQPGAHAQGIDPAAYLAFAQDTNPHEVDCMLEAKGKERALLALRQAIPSAAIQDSIPSHPCLLTSPSNPCDTKPRLSATSRFLLDSGAA